MTLSEFREHLREAETRRGQPLASVWLHRHDFETLVANAGAAATREVKGPKLPRNQAMVCGVLVVAK